MKKIGRIALGIFTGIALTVVAVGALVAHERKALANDGTGQDFVYHVPTLSTDAVFQNQQITDLRLATLRGDYHGLGIQTVIPPIPGSGGDLFMISTGLAIEYPDAGVVTVPGNTQVTTYPDGGFVTPSAGQASLRIVPVTATLVNGVADGGFSPVFATAPTCTFVDNWSPDGGAFQPTAVVNAGSFHLVGYTTDVITGLCAGN